MPKIRDLGIQFIPEKRQPEQAGIFAAAKKKPACYGNTNCEITRECTNVTGKGGKCEYTQKPPTKKKTISRRAVEQLHAQMQQKMAHTDLTK